MSLDDVYSLCNAIPQQRNETEIQFFLEFFFPNFLKPVYVQNVHFLPQYSQQSDSPSGLLLMDCLDAVFNLICQFLQCSWLLIICLYTQCYEIESIVVLHQYTQCHEIESIVVVHQYTQCHEIESIVMVHQFSVHRDTFCIGAIPCSRNVTSVHGFREFRGRRA